MVAPIDFSKKTLAIITGASQGIGRTLATELAKLLGSGSIIILVARSENGLNATKVLINEANKDVAVKVHPLDLTKPNSEACESIIQAHSDVDLAIIFHNVGQVGILDETTKLRDIQCWRNYFDLNVFSVGILNAVFIEKMHNISKRLAVVNVTSLCGRKPFHNMAMYGSGKAARELYFRVFALEEKDIVVLNYSPGPVDTPMIDEVVANLKHEEVKAAFNNMRDTKTILTPTQTVGKLLGVLQDGKFTSGDVIDYYDE